ncbi:MAG: hypothetical protein JWQ43_2388, partial [Glaciihabitans sp.]|nr:hypothetical protein [Glaciihabitans sp.]
IQTDISAVTGDDAAMSVMGVGVEFAQAQSLFTNRLAELERGVIAPLDQAASAVLQAEADLARLRHKQVEVAASLWSAYQPGYELFLNERFAEPEEAGAVEGSESTTDVAESTGDTESSTSPGSSNSAESSDSADSSTAPDSSTSADLPASAPAAANAEASTADDTSETDSTKEGVWR